MINRITCLGFIINLIIIINLIEQQSDFILLYIVHKKLKITLRGNRIFDRTVI